MDEKKKTEVEVTTEVSGVEDVTQEITIEESSGPSKSFVALAVGGLTALVIGTIVVIAKHKKKKAAAKEQEEIVDGDFEDDLYEDESELETEETQEDESEKLAKGSK